MYIRFLSYCLSATATEDVRNTRDLTIMICLIAVIALAALAAAVILLVRARRLKAAAPPPPEAPHAYDIATLREYYELTPREGDVLERMLCGDDDMTIAEKLGITLTTVHGHVRRIYEKTEAHSFRELVGACRMCEKPDTSPL